MWVIQIDYYKIYGDGGHSAVLRTLPLSGSLNRRICGSLYKAKTCSETERILDDIIKEMKSYKMRPALKRWQNSLER